MGSLSKSLFKMSKKLMKSATKDIKSASTYKSVSDKKSHNSNIPDLDSAYDEFESQYYKVCEKMEHKVYNVDTDNIDPDKNVAGFKKMLALAHELEDFCISHGQGGIEYFRENYSDIYQTIQADLDSYLKNEYQETKEYFEEEKAHKKAVNSLSGKILKEIQASGGSMPRKDIRKIYSEPDRKLYDTAIRSLIESGKIKQVQGKQYIEFTIK